MSGMLLVYMYPTTFATGFATACRIHGMSHAFQSFGDAPNRMERVVAYKPGVIHADMGKLLVVPKSGITLCGSVTSLQSLQLASLISIFVFVFN